MAAWGQQKHFDFGLETGRVVGVFGLEHQAEKLLGFGVFVTVGCD